MPSTVNFGNTVAAKFSPNASRAAVAPQEPTTTTEDGVAAAKSAASAESMKQSAETNSSIPFNAIKPLSELKLSIMLVNLPLESVCHADVHNLSPFSSSEKKNAAEYQTLPKLNENLVLVALHLAIIAVISVISTPSITDLSYIIM